jgi:hypothetical protein
MKKADDLTGLKFGLLTVLGASSEMDKSRKRLWRCQCECGGIKLANGTDMKRGRVMSCGCKYRENIKMRGLGIYKEPLVLLSDFDDLDI